MLIETWGQKMKVRVYPEKAGAATPGSFSFTIIITATA
jgi:hypothetical protein